MRPLNNRKLKILYFSPDQTNWVKENWEYFKSSLNQISNVQVKVVSEGGAIEDIMKKNDFIPDFIFFDDIKKTKEIEVTGLNRVHIPKGVLTVDVHYCPGNFRRFVKRNKINLIFSVYRDAFFRYFPEFTEKFVWLPHHVYTAVFKDYKLEKSINYLLMGAVNNRVYPLRAAILKRMMTRVRGFVYHEHPGYKYFGENEREKVFIGKKYAEEINRSKIFFTDTGIYQYPIAKYYEVAACNSLIMGAGSRELNDLGFIHRKTFVEIDKANFKEKAKYYLRRKKRREQIARRGYKMVLANHTTEIRAQQFVDCVMRYLRWKSKLNKSTAGPEWMRLYHER